MFKIIVSKCFPFVVEFSLKKGIILNLKEAEFNVFITLILINVHILFKFGTFRKYIQNLIHDKMQA